MVEIINKIGKPYKGTIILDNHESIDEILVGESSFYFNVMKSLVADLEVLFVLLLYVPSQQLWSLQNGQFT